MFAYMLSPLLFFMGVCIVGFALLHWRYKFSSDYQLGFVIAVLVASSVIVIGVLTKLLWEPQYRWMKNYGGAFFLVLLIVVAAVAIVILGLSKSKRWARYLLLVAYVLAVYGEGRILATKFNEGYLIFGGSIAVAFIATLLLRGEPLWRPLQASVWTRQSRWLAFGLIMVVTLFIKGYKYQDSLKGMDIDEAVKGRVAIELLEGQASFQPYFYFRESPYFYLVALSMKYFGPTIDAMRFTSTVIAQLALVVFYLLLQRMFNTELAFVASLLLTVGIWHNNVSRITQRLVLVPLMQVLILYILYRIVEDARWWRYCLLGIAVAAAFYTYPPIRVLPGVLILAAGYQVVARPRWAVRQIPGLGLALIFFLAAIMVPLGKDALAWPDYFLTNKKLGYFVDPWAKDLQEVKKNLSTLYLTYHVKTAPFGTVRPINANIPLLDPFVGVLLIPGIGIGLARVRQFPYFLVMSNFVIGLVPGVFSFPFQRRLIMTTLLTYAVAGIAYLTFWEQVRHALSRYKASEQVLVFLIPLTLCLPVYSGWTILQDKFFSYNAYKQRTAAYEYAARMQENYEVVMVTTYFDPNAYIINSHERIYGPDHQHLAHIQPSSGDRFVPYEQPLDRNLAYIVIDAQLRRTLDSKILEFYPSAIKEEHHSDQGQLFFSVYLISRDDANAVWEKTQEVDHD